MWSIYLTVQMVPIQQVETRVSAAVQRMSCLSWSSGVFLIGSLKSFLLITSCSCDVHVEHLFLFSVPSRRTRKQWAVLSRPHLVASLMKGCLSQSAVSLWWLSSWLLLWPTTDCGLVFVALYTYRHAHTHTHTLHLMQHTPTLCSFWVVI